MGAVPGDDESTRGPDAGHRLVSLVARGVGVDLELGTERRPVRRQALGEDVVAAAAPAPPRDHEVAGRPHFRDRGSSLAASRRGIDLELIPGRQGSLREAGIDRRETDPSTRERRERPERVRTQPRQAALGQWHRCPPFSGGEAGGNPTPLHDRRPTRDPLQSRGFGNRCELRRYGSAPRWARSSCSPLAGGENRAASWSLASTGWTHRQSTC